MQKLCNRGCCMVGYQSLCWTASFSRSGFVFRQFRVRYLIPPPQECVHVEYTVQSLHVQLNASKEITKYSTHYATYQEGSMKTENNARINLLNNVLLAS